MRNNNYLRLLGALAIVSLIATQPAKGQNSVLILKGNTVTPVTTQTTTTTPKKPVNASKSAVKTTHTTKPAATTAAKTPASKTVAAKPAAKAAAKPVARAATKPAAKPHNKPEAKTNAVAVENKHAPKQKDYIKRVQFVHNLITRRLPQSTIDSVADVNHYMLDSIREEITKHRDKDSVNFLKTALANGTNDSLVIVTINNLLNTTNLSDILKNTGSINAYCIDLSTQAPMDSVKVNIYSHDSLITTSYSGNDGFAKIDNVKPGEYSLSFSKNSYTPFSDRWVKVTADNVTYLEMPMTETPRFYLPRFSAQIWAMVIVAIVAVFLLIYAIVRRLGRVA